MVKRYLGIRLGSLFGGFVPDDTTDRSTDTGAGQTATQHVTHHTTHHCSRGGAFFLAGHAGTAGQNQGRDQHGSAEQASYAKCIFHGVNSIGLNKGMLCKVAQHGEFAVLAFILLLSVGWRT
jgi:hypothetical protein